MIKEIALAVLEQLRLKRPRNYEIYSGEIPVVSIWWTDIMPPKFKQRGLSAEISFFEDRAVYDLAGLSSFTSYYYEPEFPDNLIDYVCGV